MNRNIILRRLHHRPPYLLIRGIIAHDSKKLHAVALPTLDDFYLQGHFPGAPVVPGAIMQEMTSQAAGFLIAEYFSPVSDYDSQNTKGWALGVLRAVHYAKYKKFAGPDQELQIKIELIDHFNDSFRFKGQIDIDGEKIMANEFTLVNISVEKMVPSLR